MTKIKRFALILVAVLFAGAFQTDGAEAGNACPAGKLTVLGDSLSAGYGLPPGQGFPEQLDAALKAQGVMVETVNAGVSGDTTSGGLSRLDWSMGEDTSLAIVELGANDALRGISPAKTEENLDAILGRLKERGVHVLLAGMMAPPNMGDAYARQFNGIYGKLAERHGVALYPFFLEGVAADPDLNLADGIHPNRKGIEEIVRRILPHVLDLVASACGK